MAEAPLSPVGGGVAMAVDLHTSAPAVVNENSTASTDATSMVIDANFANGVGPMGLDLQSPATPQLPLKLPEMSSSSSDTEDEEQQPRLDDVSTAAAIAHIAGGLRRPGSPPPNCAICLGRCKNKCFTDSCMHQFCFKCLCEWSKVKPECPLCKQVFKSIIHNVKSMHQFEEYHVQPPTVQIPHRPIQVAYGQLPYILEGIYVNGRNQYEYAMGNWHDPRTGARIVRAGRTIFNPSNFAGAPAVEDSASSSSRSLISSGGGGNVRNQFIHRGELIEMYRQEYPDASSGTLSQLWRRYVYDRKLYALPVCDITGRFRESTARFYRDNPAQIHRLMPWINRDIVCLLRNTEHDVTTVLERVNEGLTHVNILSPDFRRRLQQYFGSKTTHFIHELNNFARSPYDMIGYDRAVQYSPQTAEEVVIEFSSSASSDEDNVQVTEGGASGRSRSRTRDSHTSRTINEYRIQSRGNNSSNSQPSMVNLLSFTISTTSEGVEAPGVTVAVSGRGTQSTAINLTTHNRASEVIIDLDDLEMDGMLPDDAGGASTSASASASIIAAPPTPTTPVVTDNIELNTSSSDECEFVLERKPPHLRTPEMVSLNSDTDSDVVFVEETKPLRFGSFSTSEEEPAPGPSRKSRIPQEGAARTNAKQDNELYNVGASTSTGLRSSGRRRMQASCDEDIKTLQTRRRRSLRTCRTGAERMRGGTQSDSDTSDSSFRLYAKLTSGDDEDYGKSRKRLKTAKARNLSGKRMTRSTKGKQQTSGERKRSHSKEDSEGSKRKKVEAAAVDSDFTSEDDEVLSLQMLKRRLAEQKERDAAVQNSCEIKSENNSANIKIEDPNTKSSDEQPNPNRIDGDTTPSGSEYFGENTREPSAEVYCHQEATTSDSRGSHSMQPSTSQIQNADNAIDNSTFAGQEVAGDEENTFSSLTQTTKSYKTHSSSRTSVHSCSSASNSVSSSSSFTTSSTPSVSSASSSSAEESDSNEGPHHVNEDESNTFNINLTFGHMLNSSHANEPWSAATSHDADSTSPSTYSTAETQSEAHVAVNEAANEAALALAAFANNETRHDDNTDPNIDMPIYSDCSSDIEQDDL